MTFWWIYSYGIKLCCCECEFIVGIIHAQCWALMIYNIVYDGWSLRGSITLPNGWAFRKFSCDPNFGSNRPWDLEPYVRVCTYIFIRIYYINVFMVIKVLLFRCTCKDFYCSKICHVVGIRFDRLRAFINCIYITMYIYDWQKANYHVRFCLWKIYRHTKMVYIVDNLARAVCFRKLSAIKV